MKRTFDIVGALLGLIALSPILLLVLFLVWLEDKHSPLYLPARIGKDAVPFTMVKIRSMRLDADKSGVESTSSVDSRITKIGAFVRRWKLDEISQLANVLVGTMSFVGPRPNTRSGVALYTTEEKKLLTVRPGITDISSIVFSDEGDILKESTDSDLDYNRLIRPWKSRLGLLYIDNQSLYLDLKLIWLTAVAIISKKSALVGVEKILRSLAASEQLIEVCQRNQPLYPFPPPGSDAVVTSRSAA